MIDELGYTKYDLTRAAVGRTVLAVSVNRQDDGPYDAFAAIVFLEHTATSVDSWWGTEPFDMSVQDMTLVPLPGKPGRSFCFLSAEGDIVILSNPDIRERIPGAGIEHPDSRNWGRMEGLRMIGEHLYACGGGGQFYRRSAAGQWHHLDPSHLQGLEIAIDQYTIYTTIDGPSETEVYIVGYDGRILYWDGATVRRLACPTRANLVNILVEDARTIWICGSQGTLLRGNHRDGFAQVPGVSGEPLFHSMARFDGRLHLAASAGTPRGLFTYEDGRLRRVVTGLSPEIEDPHVVDATDKVLCAMSLRDIVRFQDGRWERIDFPGNDPIR